MMHQPPKMVKNTQTMMANCLFVFDYSVGLALKGFILRHCNYYDDLNPLSAISALI